MTTDYLYADWEAILFGDESIDQKGDDDTSSCWKDKYPQWMFSQIESKDDDAVDPPTENEVEIDDEDGMRILKHTTAFSFPSDPKKAYNQDHDHLKQHQQIEDAVSKKKQSQFQLKWEDLDPLQQHFIQSADHQELESFLRGLDRKQSRFLEWLIFCYYHRVQCRGARHFPETFNKSVDFGHDFVWYELNGWPRLMENEDSEALQIEIGRHHSMFRRFTDALLTESEFRPNEDEMEGAFDQMIQVMEGENVEVMLIGIEQSPGHIPRRERLELECKLFQRMRSSLFGGNNRQIQKRGFLHFKQMLDDPLVPFAPCAVQL